MEFHLEIDHGDRELSAEEADVLAEETPQVRMELRRRFGKAACPEHGQPASLVTVLETAAFPNVHFRFKDICCDAYNRLLLEAAKAR